MPALGSKIYCCETTVRMEFECPGCGSIHALNVDEDRRPRWSLNRDGDKPTFSPSVLVTTTQRGVQQICHSFVTDGRI